LEEVLVGLDVVGGVRVVCVGVIYVPDQMEDQLWSSINVVIHKSLEEGGGVHLAES
jgi:hypothetical protein